MILISSASNIGSDIEFILSGKSFKYVMNNTGPRIDPWETSCFNIPQSEKHFELN